MLKRFPLKNHTIIFVLAWCFAMCHHGQCQSGSVEHQESPDTPHRRSGKKHEGGKPDTFTSPTGHFSVLFEGRPEYLKVTANGMVMNRYIHMDDGNSYSVSFAELPNAPGSANLLQAWLNRYGPVAAQNVGGRITGTYSVQLAGRIPGRQLEGTLPHGVFRIRFFIVGSRLYELYAGGTQEYVNSAAVTKFLNSLTITH